MKKLFIVVLILALIMCIAGCQNSANSESAIKRAFIEQFIPEFERDSITEDMVGIWSYGTYDGCTVGYFGYKDGGGMTLSGEMVGPFIFYYPSTTKMKAYKDGVIKSMPEAYKLGWLDDDAVRQIREIHKQEYASLYD